MSGPKVYVTCVWVGVASVWGQGKLEVTLREMPENAACANCISTRQAARPVSKAKRGARCGGRFWIVQDLLD